MNLNVLANPAERKDSRFYESMGYRHQNQNHHLAWSLRDVDSPDVVWEQFTVKLRV